MTRKKYSPLSTRTTLVDPEEVLAVVDPDGVPGVDPDVALAEHDHGQLAV